ncbi:hypothetical protein [Nocardioides sp.]|uniref:hypothetical protein n=1 Tax=Nocardioides sp. TaxID=35761 RepID=UPI002B713E3B|nr:hypothetical protein [Nocardioides sp.]HXH80851.1 hypothetical protein [Nocardioides sp.]
MNTHHDELEQMLGRDLHQQVDGMSTVPFGFSEVQGRAHRIRRNRRITAGIALAAAVAVIVPVGLTVGGTLQSKDEIQPAPSPSVPAEVSRTTLTVNGLPHGHAPEIEYFTVDGVVLPGEGTQQLPESYQALVPSSAAGGWIALGPNREEVIYLSEDFERLGSSPASGYGFATTPERDYVSWVVPENGVQTLELRSTTDPDKTTSWELPSSPPAGVVGILGPDSVVYETQSRSGTTVGLATPEGLTIELPYLNALGVDPVNGLISVQTSSTDNTGCFAVIKAATLAPAWETCDYKLGSFSPDGAYVMATAADSDGLGPTMVSMLDSRTGDLVAEFASAGRKQVTLIRPAWESGSTIIATAIEGTTTTMVRMWVDGALEEVADPVDASEYGDVPYYVGDNRASL